MNNDTTITIGLVTSLILFIISIVNFFNARKNIVTKEAENNTKINMKLDEICRTTSDIKSDVKGVKGDIISIKAEQIRQQVHIETLYHEIEMLKGNK